MGRILFSRFIACFLLIFSWRYVFSIEENFLLIDGHTDAIVLELGPHIQQPIPPCCTFNIALSLMGYDAEILKDEMIPIRAFQEGYIDDLEVWKAPQTPQSWMKHSCVWYSQFLAVELGLEKVQNYLAFLEYGNQDISGRLTKAWLSSSLKISTKEQVNFIQKMIQKKLPISAYATQMTKVLLFKEELPEGWRLYGKTGKGSILEESNHLEIVWFVGWIEKNNAFFPFAYNIRERKIAPGQSIPRVKQLLIESNFSF
jgi:beta-lactamase class D